MTYKIVFDKVPSAFQLVNRKNAGSDIRSELYYWIKTFASSPKDVFEFKFCLYDKNYYFIVTERINGNLSALSGEFREKFSMKQQLILLKRMAEILANVHKLGIVHQDIKPQNFLFRYKKPDEY